MIATDQKRIESLRILRSGRCHSLKNRAGKWYVQCVDSETGRFVRISTGHSDRAKAEAFLEHHRNPPPFSDVGEPVADLLWKRIERVRARARAKGLPFAIGIDDLRRLAERSGGHCEVTGLPFGGAGPFQPSIDRISPSAGYVPENIRLVCLVTNTAMLHYGEDAFRAVALAYCRKNGLV